MCDRHAFMNRSSAHVYFRRWDFLLDGRVMRTDSQFASPRLNSMLQMNDENYLADSLAFYRLPIRRFPSASFLGCCPPSLHSCFRESMRGRRAHEGCGTHRAMVAPPLFCTHKCHDERDGSSKRIFPMWLDVG